jgi:uncharacterized protein YwqG
MVFQKIFTKYLFNQNEQNYKYCILQYICKATNHSISVELRGDLGNFDNDVPENTVIRGARGDWGLTFPKCQFQKLGAQSFSDTSQDFVGAQRMSSYENCRNGFERTSNSGAYRSFAKSRPRVTCVSEIVGTLLPKLSRATSTMSNVFLENFENRFLNSKHDVVRDLSTRVSKPGKPKLWCDF